MNISLIISVLTVVFCFQTAVSGKNIVCYFDGSTVDRYENGKFNISDIDPELCTHINFAFIGLNEDASMQYLDPREYHDFNELVALKKSYPHLKVIISMGGSKEGSSTYSKVASDPAKRQLFAQNVLNLIEKHEFDGFDLDWEYSGMRNSDPDIDKADFVALLKELSNVLKPKGYLLTIAAAGAVEKIKIGYDVPAINEFVDMINVMVYDFHGALENYVGHVSPLYPASVDKLYYNNVTYNVDTGIQYWLAEGAIPEKMNLGVVLYAGTFTLADKTNTSLYAPVAAKGKAGPYTADPGYLAYYEICKFYADNSTYVWDDEQLVPHRFWSDQWVGFEDERSLKEKANYALNNSLGGMMIWSFDYDDFRGLCGDKYPLMNTIKSTLNQK